MKNSSKILLFILILLIGGAIILPFSLQADMKEAINISGYLISTIASTVTIIIALVLFDRFGVSKKTLDKNIETVFNLLEVIKSKTIYAEYESDSGIQYFAAISIHDNLEEFKKNKIMLEKDILFNYEDINKGLSEIHQFKASVWLPVQIRKKIEKISFISVYSVNDSFLQKNNCVKIYFHLYPEARKEKEVRWYKTNQKETTFNEFLSNLEDLVAEIKSWLNKHSNSDLELNI
jgi:esterase/lipase